MPNFFNFISNSHGELIFSIPNHFHDFLSILLSVYSLLKSVMLTGPNIFKSIYWYISTNDCTSSLYFQFKNYWKMLENALMWEDFSLPDWDLGKLEARSPLGKVNFNSYKLKFFLVKIRIMGRSQIDILVANTWKNSFQSFYEEMIVFQNSSQDHLKLNSNSNYPEIRHNSKNFSVTDTR